MRVCRAAASSLDFGHTCRHDGCGQSSRAHKSSPANWPTGWFCTFSFGRREGGYAAAVPWSEATMRRENVSNTSHIYICSPVISSATPPTEAYSSTTRQQHTHTHTHTNKKQYARVLVKVIKHIFFVCFCVGAVTPQTGAVWREGGTARLCCSPCVTRRDTRARKISPHQRPQPTDHQLRTFVV